MVPGAGGADIASGVLGAAGGIFGSIFGDDDEPTGYNKEYGEEARRQKFGSLVGQRVAMGDPSAIAFFKSRPDKMRQFVEDFGGDFLRQGPVSQTGTYSNRINTSPVSSVQPNTFAVGSSGGLINTPFSPGGSMWNAVNYGNATDQDLERAFDKTIARLSHPIAGSSYGGYSFGGGRGMVPTSNMQHAPLQPKMSVAPTIKPMAFDLNEGVKKAGTGNKYAKAIMEAKTMGR